MKKSQFIELLEEITAAHVTDRTDNVPKNTDARHALIPDNSLVLQNGGLVGGIMSASGTKEEYRDPLVCLSSSVKKGSEICLYAFRSWGGENEPRLQMSFGCKIEFYIMLPTD